MKLDAILPWWIIVVSVVAATAILAYALYKRRRSHYPIGSVAWARLAVPMLVGIMALGPSIPGGSSPPGMLNLDVLFVVDTTASMGAQDYSGGASTLRIDGGKRDILSLADSMRGAHFSLIGFDSSAKVLLPYTSDASALKTAVTTMNREVSVYSQGSSISEPLTLMLKQLKGSQDAHPKKGRLVFYFGDGEQTTKSPIKSFAPIAPYIKGGAVLGYGTAAGGKMLKYSGYTGIDDFVDGKYIQVLDKSNYDFVDALSKINEKNLEAIAQQMDVVYQNRNRGGDTGGLFDKSRAQVVADNSRVVLSYMNLYWIAAMLLVLLLSWECAGLFTAIRKLKLQGVPHD